MKDYSAPAPFLVLPMYVEEGEQAWGPLHVILQHAGFELTLYSFCPRTHSSPLPQPS